MSKSFVVISRYVDGTDAVHSIHSDLDGAVDKIRTLVVMVVSQKTGTVVIQGPGTSHDRPIFAYALREVES